MVWWIASIIDGTNFFEGHNVSLVEVGDILAMVSEHIIDVADFDTERAWRWRKRVSNDTTKIYKKWHPTL